mmetsp:Transcript_15239/g.28997  ORF Transcript_15239/g.28997 Transcript_15239/m.28997 type:complete len:143 (+) Transcript_15239:713-1141(+)
MCLSDSNLWIRYPPEVSMKIEAASIDGSEVKFKHPRSSSIEYTVDWKSMEQVHIATGTRRKIRRDDKTARAQSEEEKKHRRHRSHAGRDEKENHVISISKKASRRTKSCDLFPGLRFKKHPHHVLGAYKWLDARVLVDVVCA